MEIEETRQHYKSCKINSDCKKERWQNDLFITHEDLKLAEIAIDYTEPGVTTRRDVWN